MRIKNNFIIAFSIHIVLFLYFFNVYFSFLPILIGSRTILSIISVFFNLILLFKYRVIKKKVIHLIFVYSFVVLVTIYSLFINNSQDLFFIKYIYTIILTINGGYFVYNLFQNYYKQNVFIALLKGITHITLIQVFIGIVGFIVPSFKSFIINIQSLDVHTLYELYLYNNYRFFGLGFSFFGAGVIFCINLIIISYLILNYKSISKLKLVFMYILFSVVGLMYSRSVGIGIILSIFMYFVHNRFYTIFFNKYFYFLLITFMISLLIIFNLKIENGSYKKLERFAFEPFVNYIEKGTFETESSNQLKTMYVYPDNIKTWLIGDGYFFNPNCQELYYMGTDVGYLRLIFYFGVFGLFIFLCYQFYLFKIDAINNNAKFLFYNVFILYLIILFKGYYDITFFSLLFYFNFKNVRS